MFDGCYAHVFSRSIEKRNIFKAEKDFGYFKRLLIETKRKYFFQIFHYCLMHTHFHLALRIGNAEAFSQGMKAIKYDYACHFNRRNKRRGPLWQNRFKSLLIENERYLYACGLYIENNPVEAWLVKNRAEWPHSSARHYERSCEDPVVDDYVLPVLGTEQQHLAAKDFTKGAGIGSAYFRFQLQERQKLVPVP